MQEQALYAALLADLSEEELAEMVGREIRRRKKIGAIVVSDVGGGHSYMAMSYPHAWDGLQLKSPSEHLNLLAEYMSLATEVSRRLAEPEERNGGNGS